MENRDYSSVIGSSDAPYVNGLAARYGLATSSYAVGHPSLPNYLALLAGSTFGVNSDCTDCTVGATNLIDQLESAGLSWRAYMEDMPSPCFTGAQANGYAKKHDPFVYFDDIVNDPSRCSNVVPFSRFDGDAASGALPDFIWITPNLCNDGHDCSTATADAWLAGQIPALMDSLGLGGILFLTWDEGEGSAGCCGTAAGGHIVTIVAGSRAKSGDTLMTSVDHYSILKTIEELYGASSLRGAACTCTNDLMPLLRSP
ncbi:MAG: alkaline phosphatase family protein [Actinomycetota bacterium]|nr:alkaline phosphatase family protein [Actinomycetota bacterium]